MKCVTFQGFYTPACVHNYISKLCKRGEINAILCDCVRKDIPGDASSQANCKKILMCVKTLRNSVVYINEMCLCINTQWNYFRQFYLISILIIDINIVFTFLTILEAPIARLYLLIGTVAVNPLFFCTNPAHFTVFFVTQQNTHCIYFHMKIQYLMIDLHRKVLVIRVVSFRAGTCLMALRWGIA